MQGLVDEGRRIVNKEVQQFDNLIESNYRAFKSNLDKVESKSQELIQEQLYTISEDYQLAFNILTLLEIVEVGNHQIMNLFCKVNQKLYFDSQGQPDKLFTNSHSPMSISLNSNGRKLSFQPISNNSADYLFISYCLDPIYYTLLASGGSNMYINDDQEEDVGSSSNKVSPSPRKKNTSDLGANSPTKDRGEVKPLELARLYKISLTTITSGVFNSDETIRLYTILTWEDLSTLLEKNWKSLSNGKRISQLFSNDAALLSHLAEETLIQETKLLQKTHDISSDNGKLGEVLKTITSQRSKIKTSLKADDMGYLSIILRLV